jgi:hypothetical protein
MNIFINLVFRKWFIEKIRDFPGRFPSEASTRRAPIPAETMAPRGQHIRRTDRKARPVEGQGCSVAATKDKYRKRRHNRLTKHGAAIMFGSWSASLDVRPQGLFFRQNFDRRV